LWKWNQDWLSGTAIEHALALEYATRPAAKWLLDYPLPLKLLTQATLGLELLGPLVVWSPWQTARVRMAMVAAFIALHVGIELFFTPLFLSHICIVAWSVFLPASFWELPGIRRLTSFWEARMQRRAATAGPGQVAVARSRSSSRASRWAQRAGSAALLLVMAYILVWNLVTLQYEKLGFLLPVQARWLGHVTLIRQTWDMFWVPSRYNAWVEARASLADGRTIDLLGGGRPAPSDPPSPNWSFLPNSRWKVYFRRLTEDPAPDVCLSSAEYLQRAWDSTHSCEQQIVHLDLVLVQRADGGKPGTQGLVERRIARVESPAVDEVEDVLRRLRESGEELRFQP
jgi:hypothetical protein